MTASDLQRLDAQIAAGANRVIIIGGPRVGKSTLARHIRTTHGGPTYCGDPRSLVKDPEPDVEYLPEGLDWSEASAYVATHWLRRPGPWTCEGQVMVRALRKWTDAATPADVIVVLTNPLVPVTAGQATLLRGVETVWQQIASRLNHLMFQPQENSVQGSSRSPVTHR